jgi:hypothetical protein
LRLTEVVAEPQGQGKEGVSRVREAGTRKYRRAADVDVCKAIEAEIRVDDACSIGLGHTHSAHVVVAVIAARKESRVAGHEIFVGHDAGHSSEDLLSYKNILANGLQFPFGYLPIEPDTQQAERIPLVGQSDAAAGRRLLFAVNAEEDANLGGTVSATTNLIAPRLAG